MNAQQEAVALWKFLESRGLRPTVRKVGRMLRDEYDLHFTETNIRAWLKNFVASPTQADAKPTRRTRANDATPNESDASPTRLRAHSKVSLVSKPVSSIPTEPTVPTVSQKPPVLIELDLSAPETASKPKKAAGKRREPPESDLAAYRLLDALWSRMELTHGITATEWKSRNKKTALSMLASGVSADDWLAFWDEAAEAGFRYLKLPSLQEGYARRSARLNAKPSTPLGYDIVDHLELRAKGLVDRPTAEEEAAMLAARPPWFVEHLAKLKAEQAQYGTDAANA